MLDYLRALWRGNPVRVASVGASVAVFAAAKAGLVLDQASVGEALLTVVPILLGGEVARKNVTPYVGEVGPPSDDLLPLERAPLADDPATETFNEATGDFRPPPAPGT